MFSIVIILTTHKGIKIMNIKLNVSGLLNILTVILVITLLFSVAGCASDPHGLRTSHITVTENIYMNGDCAGEVSLATCDILVKKGINNQKFIMIR